MHMGVSPPLDDPTLRQKGRPAERRSFRSIALKTLLAGGLISISFWLTLQILDSLKSPWDSIASNVILVYGDASASTVFLSEATKFRFGGYGYTEIQNTNGLNCLKFKCRFSLEVAFEPVQADPQLIIGQSFEGEPGWRLFLTGGGRRLLLQTEDQANELAATFMMKPRQRYRIGVTRDEHEVRLSLDDVVVAKSSSIPFADSKRNLTIGGRAGSVPHALVGEITNVRFEREIARP
jgi:hypothetical protein